MSFQERILKPQVQHYRSNLSPEFIYICTILSGEYVKKILLHNRISLYNQLKPQINVQFALSFFPLSFGVSLTF